MWLKRLLKSDAESTAVSKLAELLVREASQRQGRYLLFGTPSGALTEKGEPLALFDELQDEGSHDCRAGIDLWVAGEDGKPSKLRPGPLRFLVPRLLQELDGKEFENMETELRLLDQGCFLVELRPVAD